MWQALLASQIKKEELQRELDEVEESRDFLEERQSGLYEQISDLKEEMVTDQHLHINWHPD